MMNSLHSEKELQYSDIVNIFREMVKDEFFNVKQLIQVNRYFIRHQDSPGSQFTKESWPYKLITRHANQFLKGDYTWEKSVGLKEVQRIRYMTHLPYLTTIYLSNPNGTRRRVQNNYIELVDPAFMQKAFPLDIISNYMSIHNTMFGTDIFHQSQLLQGDILEIFLKFHLMADFKFQPKIDGSEVKIVDPLTRINIRNRAQADEFIMKKYFNETFNLKKFVFSLFENCFPYQKFRYIKEGQIVQRVVLQITEYMFQVGLWTYEDHEQLLLLIMEKAESIATQEKSVIKLDNQITLESQVHYFKVYFDEIKELILLILIQVITIVNDSSIKQALSFTRTEKTIPKSKNNSELLANVCYKSRELNHQILNILVKVQNEDKFWHYYQTDEVDNANILTRRVVEIFSEKFQPLEVLICDVFMILSSSDNDVYYQSCKLVSPQLLEYKVSGDRQIQKLREEMYEITMNLNNLIKDIMTWNFKEIVTHYNTGKSNSDLAILAEELMSQSIKYVMNWIYDFILRNSETQDQKFTKQMICQEYNIVNMVLALIRILLGIESHTTLMLYCSKVLITICEDNMITQSQLLIGNSEQDYQYLNQTQPLIFALINRTIFFNDFKIINSSKQTFENFFDNYKHTANKVFETFTNKAEISSENIADIVLDFGKLETLNLETEVNATWKQDMPIISKKLFLEGLLSIITYNTFLQGLMDQQGIELSMRESYDLEIQRYLAETGIVRIILKVIMEDGLLQKIGGSENDSEPVLNLLGEDQDVINQFLKNYNKDTGVSKTSKRIFEMKALDADINQIMILANDLNMPTDDIKGLVFELAVSTLRLFNKSCRKILYGSTYRLLTEPEFAMPTFQESAVLAWQRDIKEYSYVILELCKYFTQIRIFPNDSMLGKREIYFERYNGISYSEKSILNTHMRHSEYYYADEYPLRNILSFLSQIETVEDWHRDQQNPWVKLQCKHLLSVGILPMIYKYVKGLHRCFFIDTKFSNASDLGEILQVVYLIYSSLKDQLERICKIFEIPCYENLMSEKKFKIVDKIKNSTENDAQKIQLSRKQKEKDELAYPKLFAFRTLCEDILHLIENIQPEQNHQELKRYYRPSAIKRKPRQCPESKKINNCQKHPNTNISEFKESYYGKFSFKQEISGTEIESASSKSPAVKEYTEVIKHYYDEKRQYLDKNEDSKNFLIDYFKTNPSHMRLLSTFILKNIYSLIDPSRITDLTQSEKESIKEARQQHEESKGLAKTLESKLQDEQATELIASQGQESELNEVAGKFFESEQDKFEEPRRRHEHQKQLFKISLDRDMEAIFIVMKNSEFIKYLRFLNKMTSLHPEFKLGLYSTMCYKWQDKSNVLHSQTPEIKRKLGEIWDGEIPDFLPYISDFQEVLSMIYYIFVITLRFIEFKTFFNDDWEFIYDINNTVGTFLKNLCEDNTSYFKNFLGEFVPDYKLEKSFTKGRKNLVYDMYIRLESFHSLSATWINQENRLTVSDKPELFVNNVLLLGIITEFVNGPCQKNQRQIYLYRGDIWSGIIYRIIDDMDSHFYFVKEKALDFILGLMEGEGEVKSEEADTYKVTKYWSNNFSAAKIYRLMHTLLKKLVIASKCKTDPKIRENLELLVQENRRKQIQLIKSEAKKSGKKLSEFTEYKNIKINEHQSKIFSDIENSSAIISDEVMEAYKLTDYKELMQLYHADPYFSEHPIIMICLKLFALLQSFSKPGVNQSMELFVKTKIASLTMFYQNEMDEEDLIENAEQYSKIKKEFSEDMVSLMFLLKISRKIEISVENGLDTSRFNKIVYFPIMPQSFFLEKKTFLDFLNNHDLENSRYELMKLMPLFFREMDQNHSFSKRNQLVFSMSKNDSFYIQQQLCWIFSFLINLACINVYRLGENEDRGNRDIIESNASWRYVIIASSLIFSAYNFILFLVWLIVRAPDQNRLNTERYKIDNPFDDVENSWVIQSKIKLWYTFLGSKPAISFILHSIFSLLGVTFDHVFNTFNLLLIVNISKTCWFVLEATFKHGSQLLSTFILAIFIIFSYSVISSNFYSDQFDIDSIDVCTTLRGCFFYLVNLGFRNGGGIADSMKIYRYGEDQKFGMKVFFDLSFFIIITVIILNIVFGVIIDTFDDMRTKFMDRETILKNYCLICQNQRQGFEEDGTNFNIHKTVHHQLWLYVYYIKYLIHKRRVEYTGDEVSVWSEYDNGLTNWMPLRSTLYLSGSGDIDELEAQSEKLEKLSSKINNAGHSILEMKTKVDSQLARMEKFLEEQKNSIEKIGLKVGVQLATPFLGPNPGVSQVLKTTSFTGQYINLNLRKYG